MPSFLLLLWPLGDVGALWWGVGFLGTSLLPAGSPQSPEAARPPPPLGGSAPGPLTPAAALPAPSAACEVGSGRPTVEVELVYPGLQQLTSLAQLR